MSTVQCDAARVDRPKDAGRRTTGWLAAAVLTLSASAAPPPAAAEQPVRVTGVTYLGDLPTLIAREHGLFERHGVPAEVSRGHSGKQNLEDLRAGRTDFALMAVTPFVLDRLSDPAPGGDDDPVVLASLVHSSRLNDIITLGPDGPTAPRELAGGRLGLLRGTNAEFLWWLFAHYHRLDPDAVELVDLPVADLGDALLAGDIDAVALWEPWSTYLAQRADGRLQRLPGGDIYTAKWILVTTRQLARERPDLASRVLLAYRDAIHEIEQRPRAALELHAADAGIRPDAAFAERNGAIFGLGLDWSLVATIQQQIEWAETTRQVDARGDVDILSWIEREPLRRALPAFIGLPESHAATDTAP